MTTATCTCKKGRRSKPASDRAQPPRVCPKCGTALVFQYNPQTGQSYYVCPNRECNHIALAVRQRHGVKAE